MSSQDPRIPPQPMEGDLREDRARWQRDKEDFGRRFIAFADGFFEQDNRIVTNLAMVTDSLATYAQEHPERLFAGEGVPRGVGGLGDIAGAGLGADIFDFIKEIILADKDLIRDLAKKFLGLD